MAQTVNNLPAIQETQFRSPGWKDPLEKKMANLLQYSCLENSRTEEPDELQPMGSQRVGHD